MTTSRTNDKNDKNNKNHNLSQFNHFRQRSAKAKCSTWRWKEIITDIWRKSRRLEPTAARPPTNPKKPTKRPWTSPRTTCLPRIPSGRWTISQLLIYHQACYLMSKYIHSIPTLFRLGLALNFSVFFYEIINAPDKACQLAKEVRKSREKFGENF